jgi:hypothetical protein
MLLFHGSMRAMSAVVGLGIVGAVSGCATTLTLPVAMAMQNSAERFTGTATGHTDGAGEVEVTSTAGQKCVGRFVYINGRQGSGTLTCEDGRNGAFDFVSTGSRGVGQGQISGQPLTIVFGR